jgi:putative DNA primase/helicase
MALWLSECCLVRSTHYATLGELFASWKGWAECAGEFVGSQKRFGQALETRGFEPRRQGGTGRQGFDGIGLKPAENHWTDPP